MRPQPTREEFDMMTDTEFNDWWDETVEQVQKQATDEAEVDEAVEAHKAAEAERFSDWPTN